MSDTALDETALENAFAEFADAKGDRLADMLGVTEDDHLDDTNTDEGTGAAPSATSAAPAADTNGAQTTSQAQPAPAAAAPAAATTDIWANAPADLREAHNRALAAADHRYRSDIGRQAGFQRRIQVLEDENRTLRGGTPAPAATDGTAAPTTTPATNATVRDNARIKEAREAYPEVIDPLLEGMTALEQRLDAIQGDVNLTKEERATATQEAQEAAMNAAHPDWRTACATPAFADWLNAQPKSIREIVERNGENIVDAEEAITMVGNFKAHLALTNPQPVRQQQQQQPNPAPQPTQLQQRRQAQLTAVTNAPKGGQPAAVTEGAPGGEGEALFNHFAAKKQKAQR